MSVALIAQNVWLHSEVRQGPVKAYRFATATRLSTLQKAWHFKHATVKGLVQASQHQQLTTSDPATASSSDTDTIAAVVTGEVYLAYAEYSCHASWGRMKQQRVFRSAFAAAASL